MSQFTSPETAKRILKWFCKSEWQDELLGDLEEEFEDTIHNKGRKKAILNYYLQVLLLIRPHIIRKRIRTPSMLKNYIKSAYRGLKKNKVYSIINISGLTVGITCCLLISMYVQNEMSYDNFFRDSDRIYRVALERVYPTNTRFFGSSPVNMAPTILENYPEVEEAGRLHRLFFQNEIRVEIGDKSFIEEKYLFADNNFFRVFSFNFIEGNPETALNSFNKVVITETTAKRFYGEESALNKTYQIDTSRYIVSGVVEDVSSNSHMDFDILGSIESLPFLQAAAENNSWINPWLFTYVKLKEGVRQESFQEKLPEMVQTHAMASILRMLNLSIGDYAESGNGFNYFLQPLDEIHLKSNLSVEIQPNGDITYVYILIAVVSFILIISCINFINLATARSAERAKEVGVRKVLGSRKTLLIKQFLVEANIITLISSLLAVLLTWIVLPKFNTLIDKSLILTSFLNPTVITGLLLGTLIVGTIAGLYPALVISSINSAQVLKGNYNTGSKGVGLRNSLIVFQFFISITMISGMLLLNKQMTFMQNKDLGYNKDNMLIVDQAQELGNRQQAFKNELLKIDGVEKVTYAFAMPGDFIGNLIVNSEQPDIPQVRTFTSSVDDNFISTLELELLAGRDFMPEFNDSLNVIVNETTAFLLGYNDAIGNKIINSNGGDQAIELTIVGVVRDYHHQSLHEEIPPMILFNTSDQAILSKVGIKVDAQSLTLIKEIEELWKDFDIERPISFSFLEDRLASQYKSDQKTSLIFTLFTVVTIIMACVGLFGLAAYVTQQRTKEIGVRKTLGASIFNIILLLSWNFSKLILVSFVLSIPVVYFGMETWLNSFAYHTSVDPITIITAGLLTTILSWITISYYSVKIAVLNPVDSLRSE